MTTKLNFYSDIECLSFLWRNYSPRYETQTLVLDKHTSTVENLEQAISQDRQWRVLDSELRGRFGVVEKVRLEKLKTCGIHLQCELENGWIFLECEMQQPTSDDIVPLIEHKEQLDLVTCMLSFCIDQTDGWSAARFFAVVCPQVLPALRQVSAEKGMTILQTLFSYTMNVVIEESDGTNEILNRHINVLKYFDKTIDKMHSAMSSSADTKKNVLGALQIASTYLLSLPGFSCSAAVRNAVKFVESQIADVYENIVTVKALIPDESQKVPSFVTETERLVRFLLDRMVCMDLIPVSTTTATPLFKTPKAKVAPIVEVDETTPKQQRQLFKDDVSESNEQPLVIASFINNSTPTPRRPVTESDALIEDDEFDDVENSSPDEVTPDEEKTPKAAPSRKRHSLNDTTPQRGSHVASKRRSLESAKPKKLELPKKKTGPTKKNAVAANQKTISSFFAKKV